MRIMVPLLAGLAAAHAAGIIHRDVKPENVLIAPDGHLKVVDFGLARALTVSSQTRTGLIIGTVAYLAPEQVAGSGVDARTDVYAAGIVLFELLTGAKPHTGDTPLAVAYKHVNEPVPPPSQMVAGVTPEIDRLVAMATSRDPRGRPADAAQFLRMAESVIGGLPAGGPPAGGPPAGTAALLADPYGPPGFGGPEPGGHRQSTQVLGPDGRTMIAPREDPGFSGPSTDRYGTGYEGGGRRRRVGALVALALVIFALAGAGGWWLTQGRYATVPSVAGMTDGAAVTALRADGFQVRIGSAVTDNNAKQGTVVRTVPAEGGRAAKGSAVMLIPSAGPQMIKVPPVAGQQLTAAQAALRGAGLSSQVRRVASSSAAAGVVVSTQPGAGTPWPQPQPVVLMVSEGPPLPYLVGQNVQTIQQWASQNGITLNVQQDPNSTQPQGIITRQSPAAGTPIAPNETVTIGVSAGPPQVAVPNVDGQTVDQARQTLKQLGFDVKVSKFGPFNKVFDYTPSGQQPKGTTITLWAGF
jgi:serine/threonine-protein kinase